MQEVLQAMNQWSVSKQEKDFGNEEMHTQAVSHMLTRLNSPVDLT